MKQERISIYPDKDGLDLILGSLEAKIMEIVWSENKVSVKQAFYKLQKSGNPAYTTVMTVMNRLVEKELLKKVKNGRHFEYSAFKTKEIFLKERISILENSLKKLKSLK